MHDLICRGKEFESGALLSYSFRFDAFVLQTSALGGKITNEQQYKSSGRAYSRGECSFNRSAPTEDGEYKFIVDFHPSRGVRIVKTITIRERNRGNVNER